MAYLVELGPAKQIGIIVVMFTYFAYFALRAEVEDEERRARLSAVYAILAGLAAPYILKVVAQLPVFKSLHPPDTLQPGRHVHRLLGGILGVPGGVLRADTLAYQLPVSGWPKPPCGWRDGRTSF